MILTGKSRLIVLCPDARDAIREVAVLEKTPPICVMLCQGKKVTAAEASELSRDVRIDAAHKF